MPAPGGDVVERQGCHRRTSSAVGRGRWRVRVPAGEPGRASRGLDRRDRHQALPTRHPRLAPARGRPGSGARRHRRHRDRKGRPGSDRSRRRRPVVLRMPCGGAGGMAGAVHALDTRHQAGRGSRRRRLRCPSRGRGRHARPAARPRRCAGLRSVAVVGLGGPLLPGQAGRTRPARAPRPGRARVGSGGRAGCPAGPVERPGGGPDRRRGMGLRPDRDGDRMPATASTSPQSCSTTPHWRGYAMSSPA